MPNDVTLPAVRRPRLPLLLPLLLLLAPSALAAQAIRIHGPAQLPENSRGFFTVTFSGLPELSNGEPFGIRMNHPSGGLIRARWQPPYEILWDFGDGTPAVNSGERPTVAHVYEQQGSYTVRVEARNQSGRISTATRQITVENVAPRIGQVETLRLDDTPRTLELSARVIDSPADEISYRWDLGDGTLREGPDLWRVRQSWPEEGRFLVRLTARDADGGETTATHEVEIRGAGSVSASVPPPADPREALASTSFSARSSGAIGAVIEGRIEPMRGLYLRSVRPGVCRLALTAWDPGTLASFSLVADLRGLRATGATRFNLTAGQLSMAFDDSAERYRARRSTLTDPGVGAALRDLEALMEMAGGNPQITERIGVDPRRAGGGPPEARSVRAASPFGLDEPASFERIGGSFTLTLRPHDRLEAEFDLLLQNTDEDAPVALRILNVEGSFVLDLQGARGEGMISYEDCFSDGFSIAGVTPERDAQHSSAYTAVRVNFDSPYDPSTLDESTFEVRYRDRRWNYVSVEGRIYRSETSAVFVPREPLLGGVRYEARVRTGDSGVRGRNGRALEDTDGTGYHSWSFGTRILFRGADPHHNLSCHIFQTVRDAPLVRGKPAVARIYANWEQHADVHAADQVEEFYARLTLKDAQGRLLASAMHDFVRPDLWDARGISLADAKHTANIFRWSPRGDEGEQLQVDIEVATRPGRWEQVYSTRCPASYWGPRPQLRIHYHLMAMGDWSLLRPHEIAQPVLDAIVLGELYAWQLFPFVSVQAHYRGVITLPLWFYVDRADRALSFDSNQRTPADVAAAIARDYANLHASGADVVMGFHPRTLNSGGEAVRRIESDSTGVIIMGFDDDPAEQDSYVYAWVHELGHTLQLEHIPYIAAGDRAAQRAMRDFRHDPALRYRGIEGFRISRDGRSGFNKSSREGNGEGPRIAPLMFPATIRYQDAFIASHHYHQLQEWIERTGLIRSTARSPAGSIDLASASPTTWIHAVATTDRSRQRHVGIAGFTERAGNEVWIGPLVRLDRSASASRNGEYAFALLDHEGVTLSSTRFDPMHFQDGDGVGVFSATVPWSDRTAGLEISRGGTVLARRRRSASPPQVSLTAPSAGQRVEGSVELSWTASDPDGDRLSATVLYSGDGIEDWSTLALWLEASSFTADLGMLEPGPNPTFRVVVSDGFDQAEADVAVRLANQLKVLAALPGPSAEASTYPDIIVKFNSDLTPESAAAARVRLYGNGGEGTETEVEYDAFARILIVSPATPLAPDTRYEAVLEGALADHFGNRLETPFRWEFRTAPSGGNNGERESAR